MEDNYKKDNTQSKSSSRKNPKVVVFGNEVGTDSDDECCKDTDYKNRFRFHYRRHGSLTWGLILILVGLMFLLSNFGALPPVVWSQIAHLWPILIILIGVETLVGHSDVSDFIGSLIGLFIFATILGVIFLHTAPQIIFGLPPGIQNYLNFINSYLQIR